MLSKAKKWAPYDAKCTTCKAALPKDYQVRHGPAGLLGLEKDCRTRPDHRKRGLPWYPQFCQRCAYRKGICAMCGKQVLDTSGLKMSTA